MYNVLTALDEVEEYYENGCKADFVLLDQASWTPNEVMELEMALKLIAYGNLSSSYISESNKVNNIISHFQGGE